MKDEKAGLVNLTVGSPSGLSLTTPPTLARHGGIICVKGLDGSIGRISACPSPSLPHWVVFNLDCNCGVGVGQDRGTTPSVMFITLLDHVESS